MVVVIHPGAQNLLDEADQSDDAPHRDVLLVSAICIQLGALTAAIEHAVAVLHERNP